METTEQTFNFHMLDDRLTKEASFDLFRKEFKSTRVMVYDDCMVYKIFRSQHAQSVLDEANTVIKSFKLPLKATIAHLVLDATLIIQEK